MFLSSAPRANGRALFALKMPCRFHSDAGSNCAESSNNALAKDDADGASVRNEYHLRSRLLTKMSFASEADP